MEMIIPSLNGQIAPFESVSADWLIVPTFEGEPLPPTVAALDSRLDGAIARLRSNGDLTGKANETVPILALPSLPTRRDQLLGPPEAGPMLTVLRAVGIAAQRILCLGLGKRDALDRTGLHDAASTAGRVATGKPTTRLAFALPDGLPAGEAAVSAGVGLMQGCLGPGLRKSTPSRFAPTELCLVAEPGTDPSGLHESVRRAEVEGRAVALARELVNLPPRELYPESFADRARRVAAVAGFECDVMDTVVLEREHMDALLGVAEGSERPPNVVVLRYRGGRGDRTLGLVGKGVTFDSGGLSLKTNEQMIDMKCDMAGAAAVLGAFQAAAALKVPVNLLGVLALVENMPSGRALKLGDVLRARTGKTIEILNTDAEGRVILADALSYAADLGSSHLVDLATLTGACVVALGTSVAGLMANDEVWGREVLAAGRRAGERSWQLPLWPLYDDLLKSNVADYKNAPGTRYGGAIAAAKFLEQFVAGKPWAHLDIAGPAWAERENAVQDAGGTGYGVRTLVELALTYEKLHVAS
jgi:leucyl aminopeptidase